MNIITRVMGVAVVVALLSGCTASPARTPDPSATAAADPIPSVTHTPTPTRPALTDLVISPEGIGPLHIGQPVPEATDALAVVSWDAGKCFTAGQSGAIGTPGVGQWVPNYPQAKFPSGLGPVFSVYTVGDRQSGQIHSLWAWTADIKTSTGIGVGSTLAALKAAYPQFDYVIPSDVVTLYVLDSGVGRMIFEVAKAVTGQPNFWKSGEIGTVILVHVQPRALRAYAISGSSDGLGICSETPGFSG